MSGLHNTFPAYMYRRGNLFGQALRADLIPTAAEQAEAGGRPTKPKPKPRRSKRNPPPTTARSAARPAAPGATPEISASEMHARLWQFLTTRLTGAELGRWERLVAAHQPDRAVARRRGWVLVASLSNREAARYLAELERRAAAGERLVRP